MISFMRRLIYSLELDLGADAQGQQWGLIVPLDAAGMSSTVEVEGKTRAVDIRVGDFVRHAGRRFEVREIRAYRQTLVHTASNHRDGWLGPPPKTAIAS